jgi:copper(I)-binding protein
LFLTMVNRGDTADALTLVETDAAAAVEFFLVQPTQYFSPTTAIAIPADSYLVLDPGPGYHIIIHEFVRDMEIGDTIDLALTFDQAEQVTIQVEMRPPRSLRQGQERERGQP